VAVFDDVLARLPEDARARICGCLASWSADEGWCQVADNLRQECALAPQHFELLLRAFDQNLAEAEAEAEATGTAASSAWKDLWRRTCEPYELHGAPLPDSARPPTLGRAWSVGSLARSMSPAMKLPEEAVKRMLDKHLATKQPLKRLSIPLRATPLGGDLIWATFDAKDTSTDPFDGLPPTAAAVRCALGLGFHRRDEPIVALTYRSSPPSHGLPLHRPTVADANTYSFYRPHGDPKSPWGFTAPLDPNPDGLLGMPEIVHGQVTGAALIRLRLFR